MSTDGPSLLSHRGPRVGAGEIAHFATRLAVMADAGVPLGQALRNLADQTDAEKTRVVLEGVAGGVDAGEPLSAALARYPRAFDPTFVNLARAGEACGRLPEMLERTAARLEADLETRRKLVGAMVYPAAMLVLCVGSVAFLLTGVFPKILPLFEGRDVELPGPTRFLIALSSSLTDHWPWYLAGLAGLDQVVLTPHVAGWTAESKRALAAIVLERVRALDEGAARG